MDEWKVKDHVFSVIDGLQYNLLYSVYTVHCILLANYNQRKNSPPPLPCISCHVHFGPNSCFCVVEIKQTSL